MVPGKREDDLQTAEDVLRWSERAGWAVKALDMQTLTGRLALDLLDLLTHFARRIGLCDDPTSCWTFLDTRRARNRRWCSSADCGNRHRVRAHEARKNLLR